MHIDELIIKDQFFDRRYKILDCHREMIPIWVDSGRSIKSIAQMLNVSYSTIYFIANPDKAELNKELGIKRGGSTKYYDKDKHTESVTKHRTYKQKIFAKMRLNKKLLREIEKDINRIKKYIVSIGSVSDIKITLSYGSYDDIDLYMDKLKQQYNTYKYQIEIYENCIITLNFT